MREEQKQFFMEMDLLFRQPGWARLVDGWKQERDALPEAAFWNARTIEELMIARERYALLDQLCQLPDAIAEQQKEVVIDEADSV